MKPSHLVLAGALLFFGAIPARADSFLSPFVGFGFGGDVAATCGSLTSCEERRLHWGGSIGTMTGAFGLEQEIAYAPDFFGKTPGASNAMLTLMSNVMLVLPAGPIQPYALIGLGLIRPHAKFEGLTTLNKNALGWDIGGGLNIFLTRGFGLRGDVRRLKTFNDVTLGVFSNDKISFWRGSAGLTLRF